MPGKERPQPEQPFAFTEREKLFDRISHERLLQLLNDEQSKIYSAALSYNTYGEFLFISVSRPDEEERRSYTLWGYGYHEPRERWLSDEWFWYERRPIAEDETTEISREEVQAVLDERLTEITPYLGRETQTRRGKLFETLADLTDDDGATIELEDMEDLSWLWDGE